MTGWRDVVLGDLCDRLTVGHVGKMVDEYADDGVPFLRSQNVKPFVIDRQGLLYVTDRFHRRLGKSRLRAGDVVVVRTGYPGTAAVVPETLDDSNCADLVVITPSDQLNAHVLAAIFNSAWGRSTVGGHLVGSAQQHFNVGSARALRLQLPDRATQDRIADVLCALHGLIENNRRRVELLEQMAQAIYREWFVRFRFPGHEDATFVDSPLGPIPAGWDVTTIGDVVEFRYGKALKAADRQGGSVAVVGSSGYVGWHNESLVAGPTIVVGRKGNVGHVVWVPGPCWPIDTTYFVVTELPLRYVVEQLRRAEFLNTHAAVPGLSRDIAYALPFLRPAAKAMEDFDRISGELGATVERLRQGAEWLVAIRDLLLPKLVTGQIDVSDLDLDAVVASVT